MQGGYVFDRTISQNSINNAMLKSLGMQISNDDQKRLNRNRISWNFYDGFHWEEIGNTDKPQVTINYVRPFVDKFVSFELGNGFTVKMKPEIEKIDGNNDPLNFINNVWRYNNKLEKCIELGQAKSITGNSWLQVGFDPKFDIKGKRIPSFIDPFGEYEKGKILITVLPDSIVFPVYSDEHDKDKLQMIRIMYPIQVAEDKWFGGNKISSKIYKQEWTNERVTVWIGDEKIYDVPNKYGIIPIRQIKNFPEHGKNEGISDIEDVIPLNTEINLKSSDVSEIIDYHSAPITVVYGARVGQLERGANKVWGGLPKDAKIENLQLQGDLVAAQNYISDLKKSMFEVGNIPEGVLGGQLAISNTSGVALQIALMPLLERVKVKQVMTAEALSFVNKLILLIGLVEGLIDIPEGTNRPDFFYNEIVFESILPKDSLLDLQEVQLEMKLGLTSREEAMKRLGKDNIQENIAKIDEDIKNNPTLYGQQDIDQQIELMKAQRQILGTSTNPQNLASNSPNNRPVGTNKDGKPAQVNAGFQNSPQPKAKTE